MFGKFIIFALLASAFCDYVALEPRVAIEALANATDDAVRSDLVIEEILLDGEAAPVRIEDAYEMGKMESTDDSAHMETSEEMKHSETPIESELTKETNMEGESTLEEADRIERSSENATEVIAPIMIEEPKLEGEEATFTRIERSVGNATEVDMIEEPKEETGRVERSADNEMIEETPLSGEVHTIEIELTCIEDSADNATEVAPVMGEEGLETEESRIERSTENVTETLTGEDASLETSVIRARRSALNITELTLGEEGHMEGESTLEEADRIERSLGNATEVVDPVMIEAPALDGEEATLDKEEETEVVTDSESMIETPEEDEEGEYSANELLTRMDRAANVTEEGERASNGTVEGDCKANDVCYGDSECGSGRCLGLFVGKCNCDACFNFLTCSDDSACGGLKNACNTTESRCNCIEGHKANGFPVFIDALRELCNVKDCDANTDTCFGLPCRSGRCVC